MVTPLLSFNPIRGTSTLLAADDEYRKEPSRMVTEPAVDPVLNAPPKAILLAVNVPDALSVVNDPVLITDVPIGESFIGVFVNPAGIWL
jgi:hypothetical protein